MVYFCYEVIQAITAQPESVHLLTDSVLTTFRASSVDSIAVTIYSEAVDSLVALLAATNSKETNQLMSLWVPLLSLVVALLSVIVGPYIQRRNSKDQIEAQLRINQTQNVNFAQQLRANILTTNRQKWIGELRDTISEFMSLISIGDQASNANLVSDSRRLLFLLNKGRLLLNMENSIHLEFFRMLEKTVTDYGKRTGSDEENLREIVRTAQMIFRDERNRIDNFE